MTLGDSKRNFPYKCFYNDELGEVYSFYRQGHAFVITEKDHRMNKMTDLDLGTMYLIYNKALVSRTSSEVNFFKIDEEDGLWKKYYTLPIRGFIYFIKGNVRVQISTEDKIYFYLIDKETLKPSLENVMNNYMNCL